MSTRIYNGVKFAATDFAELFGQLQRFRKRIADLTETTAGEYMASRAIRMLDETCANEMPLGDNFLSKVSREFRDDVAEIKKTGYRNPSVDFEFKVMIFPHKGEFYGMIFTEQSAWASALRDQKWVSEYSFHDSTDDTPKGVSYKDYRKRGNVWKAIIGPDYVPAAHGVELDLTLPVHWIEWEWVEAELPKHTLDSRLKNIAESRVMFARMKQDRKVGADGEELMEAGWASFMDANKWMKTDEGQVAIAAEIERCRPLLVPVLTKDVLSGSVPKEVAVEA